MLELKGSPTWIRTRLHGLTVRRLHLDCSRGINCGAPGVNRTPDLGLQNRCFTTRTNGAKFFGGECGSRTHSSAHHQRRISNPMPYHPAHSPSTLLYSRHCCVSTKSWCLFVVSNHGPPRYQHGALTN